MMGDAKWFGVKSLYRSVARGAPQGRDRHYAPDIALVEERLVLFQARSAHEALRRADREAAKYAKDRFRNAYGQQVVTEYLGYCEAYDLSPDHPGDSTEVFSAMEVVAKSTSKRELLQREVGYRAPNRTRLCRNLGDILFQKPAPGVKLTKAERAFVDRVVRRFAERDVKAKP